MSSTPPVPERTRHPYLTYEMIFETPDAMSQTLYRNDKRVDELSSQISQRKRFYFTGCGTAFFSAMLGEQFLKLSRGDLVSDSIQAFELLNYYDHVLGDSCAVIGVSHSGITKTTVDSMTHARDNGAFTVGVSHFDRIPLANVVDTLLVAGNGPDKSRCHTKCYLANALLCAKIALGVAESKGERVKGELTTVEEELVRLPQTVSELLKSTESVCKDLAEKCGSKKRFFFVGGGPNVPTALEATLKMRESSYVAADGMEVEQMLHGPWVSLNSEEAILFVVAPTGKSRARSLDLVKAAQKIRVPTIVLATRGDNEMASHATHTIELPETHEYISPFTSIIPAYLFAYYSSVERGRNPDMIRYSEPAYWEARQTIFPPGTH
jgi:glucosamine--fructose-6-phosphate aminotransferase (isomerizing)